MEICKNWNVEDFLKTNEQKIPFLIRKHLNECQKCQVDILEYSELHPIPEYLFGKNFSKQKLLWFGAELANPTDFPITKERKKKISSKMDVLNEEPSVLDLTQQNRSKFFLFCRRYKKFIFIFGYLALLAPMLQLAFQIF
ncbi:hypothetical protein [Leptospira noguchii]|uniref:Uncharacterized protein n=2 Tax=Leptospira noguchii TaxID=28182 RepID=M6UGF9_9LEPT|nr:hypothetical protein [Leptospira noguchii]EKR73436.1 hypothetical protein LEP1GSC041_3663 [Leptospira noguchii str. 2006001870]EMO40174.1 hypothetical protein LEP1GSC186_4811 [Leptospira noguchii serovar Autumnalis str. ZUN142]TQE77412.1 hypothetical protein FF021_08470 [Leptospira noguchii]UOG32645.1 hypothetical protein MAL06_20475 [Leptospira noguchii]UOG50919.1 hypothetical protein MAL00_19725 [Leptospira noguchii]